MRNYNLFTNREAEGALQVYEDSNTTVAFELPRSRSHFSVVNHSLCLAHFSDLDLNE